MSGEERNEAIKEIIGIWETLSTEDRERLIQEAKKILANT